MSLLDKFQWFSGSHGGADYFTDKLTRIYSLIVFVTLAIILSLELLRSDAIDCWAPAYFTENHIGYTNKACKYRDYYYFSFNDIPNTRLIEMLTAYKQIRYLPWVWIGQALLFSVPGLFWTLVSGCMCDLYGLVRDSTKIVTTYSTGAGIPTRCNLNKLSKTFGGFGLSMLYLVTKFMYFIICLIQLWIMYDFLGFNFMSYFKLKGYDRNHTAFTGFTMPDPKGNGSLVVSQPFPEIVLCDFEVRQMGSSHKHTVQCIYGIVDEVEMCIYIAWIWVILLIVLNAVSGMYHFINMILSCIGLTTKSAVRGYLSGYDNYENAPMGTLDKFVSNYVKPDAAFVLNMIGQNGSLYAVHWALRDMWDDFMKSSKIHARPDQNVAIQQTPQTQPKRLYMYDQLPMEESNPL